MQHNIYHDAVYHIKQNFSIESFKKYFIHSQQYFQQLTKIVKNCQLDQIKCRFNTWRLCLGVVTYDSTVDEKNKQIKESRDKYQQKKQQTLKIGYKKSPNKEPVKKNPLMMMGGPKTSEHKQESDDFLKQEIQKDVQRTYQEMKFFLDKHIVKLLSNILFIWCKKNPDVSYKQGMNELLASVVVCYFKEAEFRVQNQHPQTIDEQLWSHHLFFNSVEHAESDIYAVFQKIIDVQADMYKTQADLSIKNKVNPNSKNNTPILQRIMQIKDHKLKHMDLELFRIIKLQDVQTKSFMLRWIRCMHTREFDLQNSFVIWDSIFLEYLESESSKKIKQFEFIDAMCLAMFMYMRSIVFTKQTAGQILQVYQKYPVLKRGEYLDELITLAWTICEELRIDSQTMQTNQSNWFQQSEKVQGLHFMQKKEQKKSVEQKQTPISPHQPSKKPQVNNILCVQPVQKQLKYQQMKKQQQNTKKPSDQNQIINGKAKQTHTAETNSNKFHEKPKEKSDGVKQIQKQVKKEKNEHIVHHKSEAYEDDHKKNKKDFYHPVKPNQKTQKTQKQPLKHKQPEKKHSVLEATHPNPLSHHNNPHIQQNIQITFGFPEIYEIMQHLNQSLSKVRDIDIQSHIRKVIKKFEGKVKTATDKAIQKEKVQKQAKQQRNLLQGNKDKQIIPIQSNQIVEENKAAVEQNVVKGISQ